MNSSLWSSNARVLPRASSAGAFSPAHATAGLRLCASSAARME